MAMNEMIGTVLQYMNGTTETELAILLVIIDNLLGSSVAKRDSHRRVVSSVASSGLLRNFALAVLPIITSALGIINQYLPKGLRGQDSGHIFEIFSAIMFIMLASWLIKSILANCELLGFPLTDTLQKWVADEVDHKINKGITKTTPVTVENIVNVEKPATDDHKEGSKFPSRNA